MVLPHYLDIHIDLMFDQHLSDSEVIRSAAVTNSKMNLSLFGYCMPNVRLVKLLVANKSFLRLHMRMLSYNY